MNVQRSFVGHSPVNGVFQRDLFGQHVLANNSEESDGSQLQVWDCLQKVTCLGRKAKKVWHWLFEEPADIYVPLKFAEMIKEVKFSRGQRGKGS